MQKKKLHQCSLWFDIGNGMESKKYTYYVPERDKQERKYALYSFFLKSYDANSNKKLLHGTYEDYLQTEHWKNLKIQIFTKSLQNTGLAKRCYIENCTGANVVLHHMRYDRLGTDNEQQDLIPLCSAHHYRVHRAATYLKNPGVSIYTVTQDFVNLKNKVNKIKRTKISKYYYDEETATDIY